VDNPLPSAWGEVILLGPKWRQYGGCHGRTQISMPAKVHRSAHRDRHRPVCLGAATRSKTVSLVPLLWHRSQHIGQQDVFRRTNDAAPKLTGGGELERELSSASGARVGPGRGSKARPEKPERRPGPRVHCRTGHVRIPPGFRCSARATRCGIAFRIAPGGVVMFAWSF